MDKIIFLMKERSVFLILSLMHIILLCIIQYFIYKWSNKFLVALICGALISGMIQYLVRKINKKQNLWELIDEFLTSSLIVWFIGA